MDSLLPLTSLMRCLCRRADHRSERGSECVRLHHLSIDGEIGNVRQNQVRKMQPAYSRAWLAHVGLKAESVGGDANLLHPSVTWKRLF